MSHIDLLVLAVSRVKRGIALAGMTTEPDPVTGRKWVQMVRPDGPLHLADITLPDGALIQPGDVVRWDGLQPDPQPPFVEQWMLPPTATRTLLRHITPERYQRFFPDHVDRDPAAVLERHERSLCLVQADEIHALFEQQANRFASYMLFDVPGIGSYDNVPVTDLLWRSLGRQLLAEAESDEVGLDIDEIRERFGSVYVVLGLYRNTQLLVRGVHTVPPFASVIDPDHL